LGRVASIQLFRDDTPADEVTVFLPVSKSLSNRALVLNHLSGGKVEADSLSEADDTEMLKRAFRSSNPEIYLGEGGTTARFFMACASVTPGTRVLTGSKRLGERPMGALVGALQSLGADISYLGKYEYLPVRVVGKPLKGGSVEIPAGVSSQFVSALMMIGPLMSEGLHIQLIGPVVSRPYIEMTAALMRSSGAVVDVLEDRINVEPSAYKPTLLKLERDWSSASYFYSSVALNNKLRIFLPGLRAASSQGDRAAVELYEPLGVRTEFRADGVAIRFGRPGTTGEWIDFTSYPDLAQSLAAVYAGLGRGLRMTGLTTLRDKETDRIEALRQVLNTLGVKAIVKDSTLTLQPTTKISSSVYVETFGDHRMAMAFAPLAFKTRLLIENPDVVSKSFPHFFEEFSKLGVSAGF
jgi:3-phosphoshikimate 1-carboxyvinyltransferase